MDKTHRTYLRIWALAVAASSAVLALIASNTPIWKSVVQDVLLAIEKMTVRQMLGWCGIVCFCYVSSAILYGGCLHLAHSKRWISYDTFHRLNEFGSKLYSFIFAGPALLWVTGAILLIFGKI